MIPQRSSNRCSARPGLWTRALMLSGLMACAGGTSTGAAPARLDIDPLAFGAGGSTTHTGSGAVAPNAYLTLGWVETTDWSVVASAGDVNGDGFADLLASQDHYTGNIEYEGSVSLFLGSPTGLADSPDWTAEGNSYHIFFGSALASAGDVNADGFTDVVVGASGKQSAYVYHGSASGLANTAAWTLELLEGEFGASVASAGDVNGDGYADVVVGAPAYAPQISVVGGAFVYLGSATGLATTAAWILESDDSGSQFGTAVAGAGDVNGDGFDDVLVGAPEYGISFATDRYSGGGAAFLYYGSAAGVSPIPAWSDAPPLYLADFGEQVASAGDVNNDGYDDIVVGGRAAEVPESGEGVVFVYLGGPDGPETSPSWTLDGEEFAANCGRSVAPASDVNLDGFDDLLVICQDIGRLYLGSPSGLQTTPAWTGPDLDFVVASAGDVDGDGYPDAVLKQGVGIRVYYAGCPGAGGDSDGDWVEDDCDACPGADDRVYDADHDLVCVLYGDCDDADPSSYPGAPERCDGRDNACAGTVPSDELDLDLDGQSQCMGDIDDADPVQVSAWVGVPDAPETGFGYSTASAGDVNGDGYEDLIVGAYLDSNGESEEGRVFVYLGSAFGLEDAPSWTAESDQDGARFGGSVASAGDVNGDGFDDVIVGAELYDSGPVDAGAAFVYLGSAGGLQTTTSWMTTSGQTVAYYGHAVAGAGDVNGDGFDDVVVGEPNYDGVKIEGRVRLYLGSAAGLDTVAAWTKTLPNSDYSDFGSAVASAGDVNADGYDDVIVGARNWESGNSYGLGRADLFLGSATGLSDTTDWTLEGSWPFVHLGAAVAGAGDVDGDGYDDVLVGEPGTQNGGGSGKEDDAGFAYLYRGGPAGLQGFPAWTIGGLQPNAALGTSVAGAGDVDGDGFDDILVGAPLHDNGQIDEGRAYLFLGSPTGPGLAPAWTAESDLLFGFAGQALGTGDTNGDGVAEVIVGAGGAGGPGRVYLFSSCSDGDLDGFDACADCADDDAASYPGAPELCDGRDNACTGAVPADEVDLDGDGYLACAECDDGDGSMFPGAPELCDGRDNACNGSVPPDEVDLDGDGYLACAECDDGDGDSFPGAPELCDGRDNACNGSVPPDEVDLDGDGYLACAECNDADDAVQPGAAETCNGADDNCDGAVDEGCPAVVEPSRCGCRSASGPGSSLFAGLLGVLFTVRRSPRRRGGRSLTNWTSRRGPRRW